MIRLFFFTLIIAGSVDAIQLKTDAQFLGGMMKGLMGGGGGPPKPPKGKVGGTKINVIDADETDESHGSTFSGKINQNGNANNQNNGMYMMPMMNPYDYYGAAMYPSYGFPQYYPQPMQMQVNPAQSNWQGMVDNFFEGSFFAQLDDAKKDAFR